MVRALRSPPGSGRCGQGPPLAPGAPGESTWASSGAPPHPGPPHTSDGECCQDPVLDRKEGSENGSGYLFQSPPRSQHLRRGRVGVASVSLTSSSPLAFCPNGPHDVALVPTLT